MPEAFDRLVNTIKNSLRKSHPEWSEEKISNIAYATATIQWRKK